MGDSTRDSVWGWAWSPGSSRGSGFAVRHASRARPLAGRALALAAATFWALAGVVAPAAAAEVLRWEGRSSLQAEADPLGGRLTRLVNQRLLLVDLPEEVAPPRSLVLRETVRLEQRDASVEPAEGDVDVEVFALEAGAALPLARFAGPGESGEWLREGLYRIRRAGCCGAADLDSYFSLPAGAALLRASAPLLSLRTAEAAGRRFAGLHAVDAMTPPAERERDPTVCAVLAWSDGRAELDRVVLRGAVGVRCTARGLTLKVADARRPGSSLTLTPSAEGTSDWARREDLALVADIELGPPSFARAEVVVPIARDRFDAARARADPASGLGVGR